MNDKQQRQEMYRNIVHNCKRITEIQGTDLLQKMKALETFLVYFGFDECPWCQEAAPLLCAVAVEQEKQIYYVDTHANGNNPISGYEEIKERLIDYFSEYKGEKSLVTPLVLVFQAGKAVFAHRNTLPEHNAYKRKLHPEEQDKLKEIYREGFALLD